MSGRDRKSEESRANRALWLRSQATVVPEDETGRFLDLAAFADGRLDGEEAERIAALLARDPEAASDVMAVASTTGDRAPSVADADNVGIERVIVRACGLATQASERRRVLLFSRPAARSSAMRGLAEWTSLAAALAMVGWFGFAMGSDASLAFGQTAQQNQPSIVHELIEPDNGILHDLGMEVQT
jgi:anti-sigma factor RsiW